MKKLIVISILLTINVLIGKTQNKTVFGFFTDRDVYVSGETILAKVFTPSDNPSRIVYLDLVNQHGKRICGVSLQVLNHQSDCFLQLPDSLSSGTFLVRAYQKNTASQFKIIREIWISNRFDGLEKTNQMHRLAGSEENKEIKTEQIVIQDIASEIKPNSTVTSKIKIDESLRNQMDGNLLICVAQTDPSFVPGYLTWSSSQGKEGLTEKKGIILSVTVTDKKTLEPASGITVFLTIPDTVPGFQYYKTTKDGRYYFLMDNCNGSVQAVVQCFSNAPAQRLKITLDELFSEPGILPEFTQQPVPEEFKSNITRNIDAVTFQKIFNQEKLKLMPFTNVKQESYPYYGMPSNTVDPHLFIDLPNFTEISRELLPGVKFRNYNNEPTIRVINNGKHDFFSENPLVLIDGIPVSDLNVIKDMGTTDIKRIDICQSERFYGDLRFPGVVAIYTTKADYTRLHESDQLIHLKLETVQLPATLAEPIIPEPTIPDLRQVIFWNPSTEPQATIPVNFSTSSVIGPFKLVVRGKLKNGTLIFVEKQFEVK